MFDDFLSGNLYKRKAVGERRWYDNTFIKSFVDSFETVPPYKREIIANKIIDIVESVFKNEINKKVNTKKDMVLGMYKEFERRRWYDQNTTTLKAVKSMCSLADQRRDLQKMAIAGIIDALGEYYIREEPKEEKPPEPVAIEEEPTKTDSSKPDSKLMVSGEKLFVKRDKQDKKNKPKL